MTDPDLLPFPEPRPPGPDYIGLWLERGDINKMPPGLRASAAKITASMAERRGVHFPRKAEL